MEYFYGGGGRSKPDFTYVFLFKEVTSEMFEWCENYPLTGPFERWYIQHNVKMGGPEQPPLVQIENRKAAFMFSLAFSEYILEDKTYNFAKDWNYLKVDNGQT